MSKSIWQKQRDKYDTVGVINMFIYCAGFNEKKKSHRRAVVQLRKQEKYNERTK